MAENFYEMYLEEMEQIRPLDHEEERAVLASAARGEKEARNRLVEGYLAAALGFAREYEEGSFLFPIWFRRQIWR